MDGIINILKPPAMTSHDVVNVVRKTTGQKKAGHTGTLDPGAAGVLPVCLGKATKIIQYLPDDKRYRAEITFGQSTDTHDSFGRVTGAGDAQDIGADDIKQGLADFTGLVQQIPPMTSAIKYKGKKLYELARAGIDVERKPRSVYIYKIALVRFYHQGVYPRAILDIHCSAGTYVRTICHDLGQRLGCGAYMSFLLRTRAGNFVLDNAVTLEDLAGFRGRGMETWLLPLGKALEHLPGAVIEGPLLKAVGCGNSIPLSAVVLEQNITPEQLVRLENGGRLIALAVVKDRAEANGGNGDIGDTGNSGERYILQPVKVVV